MAPLPTYALPERVAREAGGEEDGQKPAEGTRPDALHRSVGARGPAAHAEGLQHRQETDGRVDHALCHVPEPRHDPDPGSRVPGRLLGVPPGVLDRPVRASHPPTPLRLRPAILYTRSAPPVGARPSTGVMVRRYTNGPGKKPPGAIY